MESTPGSIAIIFWVVLLLVITHPSYQYTYSCSSSAACGCSANSASLTKIVGGEGAGTNTWGWAVSIYINSSSLCGGSILSSSWVVTAAHCLSAGYLPSQVSVYAGSTTRFSGTLRTASSITVHPSYNPSTKANDIALIQLSSPLTISGSISVVCMPTVSAATLSAGEWPAAGLYVSAVGWGTLSESGSLPLNLQQVTVQTIAATASTCSSVLNDQTKQFCAGVSGGGKDTCQGDSGGPLMMFTTSNQWVLVGVTSYGIGCARANYAGVYTRVAYYQSWISTTTSNAYTNATSSDSANINPFDSSNSTAVIHTLSVSCLPIFLFLPSFFIFLLS